MKFSSQLSAICAWTLIPLIRPCLTATLPVGPPIITLWTVSIEAVLSLDREPEPIVELEAEGVVEDEGVLILNALLE